MYDLISSTQTKDSTSHGPVAPRPKSPTLFEQCLGVVPLRPKLSNVIGHLNWERFLSYPFWKTLVGILAGVSVPLRSSDWRSYNWGNGDVCMWAALQQRNQDISVELNVDYSLKGCGWLRLPVVSFTCDRRNIVVMVRISVNVLRFVPLDTHAFSARHQIFTFSLTRHVIHTFFHIENGVQQLANGISLRLGEVRWKFMRDQWKRSFPRPLAARLTCQNRRACSQTRIAKGNVKEKTEKKSQALRSTKHPILHLHLYTWFAVSLRGRVASFQTKNK